MLHQRPSGPRAVPGGRPSGAADRPGRQTVPGGRPSGAADRPGRQAVRGDGELSGQLADESGEPGEDAEEFLSDEQLAAYGCYTRPPTVDELDQFFLLDDEDRNLIADKRGDANRLGFMLQLTTLR